MNNLEAIELAHVNLLDVHRAALKQYEADAAECDANDEPITAQMFREAAERRRKMIDETEKRLRLEQQSNEQEVENKGNSSSK